LVVSLLVVEVSMRLLGVLFNAVLGSLLTAVLVLVVVLSEEAAEPGITADAPGLPAPMVVVKAGDGPRSVVLELFGWRWDDVARECETLLGPGGFAAVQVSPPNEHRLITGNPWWQRYEPVSHLLGSSSGDAAAFSDMVGRCANAGVRVYADVVFNHMTGEPLEDDPLWGIGSAGSSYDYKAYPDFGPEDFHPEGPNGCDAGAKDVDRAALQRCALCGRADLDTEADRVQDRFGAYLNGLLDMGVSGFHIGAAEHMAAGDIAGILARVQGLPVVYQEARDVPSATVRAREYLINGQVTEFGYGERVAAALRHGGLRDLARLGRGGGAEDLLPGDRALVFVDHHAMQRGGMQREQGEVAVLSRRDGALYELAHVFMLAWPYGTPRVVSGYAFADADTGPPSEADGTTLPVHGAQGLGCSPSGEAGWACEHRRPAIAAMIGFRNATEGAPVEHWWSDPDAERIAFARGERGFVVINNTDEPMRRQLETGLPAGRYCNVLVTEAIGGGCRPLSTVAIDAQAPEQGIDPPLELVVADDGKATVELPPRSAAAVHVETGKRDSRRSG
jgi:alpha-amylase